MAEDRKARLRALAARAGRTKQPAADDNDNDNDKRNDQTQSATATGTTKTKPKPNLSFRNYAPTDKGLGGSNNNSNNNNNNGDDSGDAENDESPTTDAGPPSSKRPRTAPLESGARNRDPTQTQTMPPPPARTPSDALRKALREAREDAASSASASASVSSLSNARVPTETVSDLAPKKSNWDLKRDVADKLARLEKRTQKAIVEILRERLESEAANAIGDDGGGSDLD